MKSAGEGTAILDSDPEGVKLIRRGGLAADFARSGQRTVKSEK